MPHEGIWSQLSPPTPLRSEDGLSLLKDEDTMANRWKGRYKDLLSRDTIPEMEALDQLPQQPRVEGMGEPPSLGEVLDAITNMTNNTAAGPEEPCTHLHCVLRRCCSFYYACPAVQWVV
ncbi:hypothetical protein CesoFtcFv8_000213 [Champsocephalus esox]|uniref:Uncharacterized protein n=1 Tax=Champsocephalus esox TaxID=159716 RepID=A0AAN8E753_9TELE|nr:hypothetical protein CesoFtcFv8_000213 [Champsocephalus esox]